MVSSFLVSSEIPVMINILYEIITIQHEKMLNATGIKQSTFHGSTFHMLDYVYLQTSDFLL